MAPKQTDSRATNLKSETGISLDIQTPGTALMEQSYNPVALLYSSTIFVCSYYFILFYFIFVPFITYKLIFFRSNIILLSLISNVRIVVMLVIISMQSKLHT